MAKQVLSSRLPLPLSAGATSCNVPGKHARHDLMRAGSGKVLLVTGQIHFTGHMNLFVLLSFRESVCLKRRACSDQLFCLNLTRFDKHVLFPVQTIISSSALGWKTGSCTPLCKLEFRTPKSWSAEKPCDAPVRYLQVHLAKL